MLCCDLAYEREQGSGVVSEGECEDGHIMLTYMIMIMWVMWGSYVVVGFKNRFCGCLHSGLEQPDRRAHRSSRGLVENEPAPVGKQMNCE